MKNKGTAVEITVTKKNFDAASASAAKFQSLTTTCLLAQAIKQAFPKKRVSVSSDYASVGKLVFDLPAKAQKLIIRFDNLYFGKGASKAEKNSVARLRAALPITFKMTEQVVEQAAAATA
jgi:hypothetical protein